MSQAKTIDMGKLKPPKSSSTRHIPSTVQPDTLFHFVSKPEYLIDALELRKISPRYCKEDLRYLRFGSVKELAYPMSCFCNIGLQKLEEHMGCYGYYGVAFPKKWCMDNGFQAVQYVNRNAPLAKDVRKAFKAAERLLESPGSSSVDTLSDYLLHQIMYYKPYQGTTRFRVDGNNHKKCFADECEWRYIPDLDPLDMPMVVGGSWHMDKYLAAYNKALHGSDAALQFEYQDLKYVMVEDTGGYSALLGAVDKWQEEGRISNGEAYDVLSKVLVWDEIKGDF